MMFWRGFSKQEIRALLLRLRRGRLLLSQQEDQQNHQQKQQQKQKPEPTELKNKLEPYSYRGLLVLGTDSLLECDASNARPALSQWTTKSSSAGQPFIWRDLLRLDHRHAASYQTGITRAAAGPAARQPQRPTPLSWGRSTSNIEGPSLTTRRTH